MPTRNPEHERQQILAGFQACGALVDYGYSQFETWEPFVSTVGVTLLQATDDHLAAFPASVLPLEIDLTYSTVTDAGMAHLAKYPNLKALVLTHYLDGHGVGDKGMATIIKHCPHLERLHLSPAITDRSLKALQKLPKLAVLILESSVVSDRGIRHLLPMAALKKLYLLNSTSRRTQMGDTAISIIGQMTRLVKLDLFQSKITDASLPLLSGLVELRSLSLGGCKVGAHGLHDLAALTELRSLNLESTLVTDEAIKVLALSAKLEFLSLEYTTVSDRAARKIAKGLNLEKTHGQRIWRKPFDFKAMSAAYRLGRSLGD